MRTAISLFLFLLAASFGLGGVRVATAQTSAKELKAVHAKLEAEKKQIVSQYMSLTEPEAKAFWPVYDKIQAQQLETAEGMRVLLASYAKDYNANTLTDEKAAKLLDEWIKLDENEMKQRTTAANEVMKVLPGKKAARYLQIEQEYRALLRYDLAATVPLAK